MNFWTHFKTSEMKCHTTYDINLYIKLKINKRGIPEIVYFLKLNCNYFSCNLASHKPVPKCAILSQDPWTTYSLRAAGRERPETLNLCLAYMPYSHWEIQLGPSVFWHSMVMRPLNSRNNTVLLTLSGDTGVKKEMLWCINKRGKRDENFMKSAKGFILVNLLYVYTAQTMHFWGTVQKT